jgi:DNA-binding winged helix-turn-helix (wHTH) protein
VANDVGKFLAGEVIRAGALILDTGRLEADTGQGPVPLTRLEFLLLKELLYHVGQPVPKAKLLARVWNCDFDPGSNVVDVCVRRLRSKLGFELIDTVRGEGYQLTARLGIPDRRHNCRQFCRHITGDKFVTGNREPVMALRPCN